MLERGIIAVIYDSDKTLTPKYMQHVLFDEFGISGEEFWTENGRRIEEARKQRINLDGDPAYLNLMLDYVKEGKFPGLSNQKLFELGNKIDVFPGLPDFFEYIKGTIEDKFGSAGISVEQYIVSSGMKRTIEGKFGDYIDNIFGAEFIENEKGEISKIARVIDSAGKRNILHQINKGCNVNPEIDVNASVPHDFRRVPFRNMIYVADGPNDIICFKGVNDGEGFSLGVYDPENPKSLEQAIQLRRDERIFDIVPNDYSEGSHTRRLIIGLMEFMAKRDIEIREKKISEVVSQVPRHL